MRLNALETVMPRNRFDPIPSAARNLHTVLEITDHVSPRLRPDAAHMVKGLFDLLAWSDGELDPREIALLDRLCEEVPDFRDLCDLHDTYEPTDPTFGEIPRLLTAVLEHDRRTGERLAPMLVAELEAMGYAIIGASGIPVDIAKSELRTYVGELRSLTRQLATAPSVALL